MMDQTLEREYQNRVLGGVLAFDVAWVWSILRVVAFIKLRHTMVDRGVIWPPQILALCGLLLLIPIAVSVSQRKVTETWYRKHGTSVRVFLGLVQISVSAAIFRCHILDVADRGHKTSGIELTIACGLLSQLGNFFWNNARFWCFLGSSVYSVVVWHALVIHPYCDAVVLGGQIDDFEGVITRLIFAFDGLTPFRSFGGGPGKSPCTQLLSCWHIYVCVFFLSYLVWMVERNARLQFLKSLETSPPYQGGHHRPRVPSMGHWSEHAVTFMLLLPVTWQITSYCHSLADGIRAPEN
ncbi:hypothetical protein BSKO_06143 [Bryopsis sp. KO-2023]|nr:hypothetical protein BSKO_06143 [Bryopsis sp. KO-2023]